MRHRDSRHSSNPRQAAFQVLLTIQKEGGYADQLMDRELSRGLLSGPDRGLFAELVFGVLRRRGTLDYLLDHLLDQPFNRLEQSVQVLLRVGLYQLLYLDRIPESAAVNETVNLAKQAVPRVQGLVNAVLRNYLRKRQSIPFPDPLASPAASIAARHSQPLWLVEQWISHLGPEEADRLAEASSNSPGLTLRVNTLRTSREELLAAFAGAGITGSPCRFSPHGILIEGRHQIGTLPGFSEGFFAVQDEASQMTSLLLEPQPGQHLLDACAAPGGKATHLAQLMEDRGGVLAMDISAKKVALVAEAAQRLGLHIIRTQPGDLLKSPPVPHQLFDRVLLDAPCSGLGVIRRNPEAKWRLKPEDPAALAATQRALLKQAAARLKPGGLLVYSTCSTAVEENEAVVLDFLSQCSDFVLEDLNDRFPAWQELFTEAGMFRAWPHRHGMDGFFAARLRRQ